MVFGFADSTEKTMIIEDVPQEDVGDIKDNILAVNENLNGAYNALYNTFISNAGASFTGIISGKLVTVEEDVIYNG